MDNKVLWYTAEMTLTFILRGSSSQKLARASPQNFKIKSSHQDYLDMLVINKGSTFIICLGPHKFYRHAWVLIVFQTAKLNLKDCFVRTTLSFVLLLCCLI